MAAVAVHLDPHVAAEHAGRREVEHVNGQTGGWLRSRAPGRRSPRPHGDAAEPPDGEGQRVFRVGNQRRLHRPPREVADLIDPHRRPAGQHCLHRPLRKGHLRDAIGVEGSLRRASHQNLNRHGHCRIAPGSCPGDWLSCREAPSAVRPDPLPSAGPTRTPYSVAAKGSLSSATSGIRGTRLSTGTTRPSVTASSIATMVSST